MSDKIQTCIKLFHLRSLTPVHTESYIRNHAEQVRLIFSIHSHRIVKIGCKKDLRTRTLHMLPLLLVKSLFQEFRTLLEHHTVQLRQICRIISYGVFHEEYSLYADPLYVVVSILKVLEELDDGYDEVCISMPAEHIVNAGGVESRKSAVDLLGEVGQEHKRQTSSFFLQLRSQGEDIIVSAVVHADDHVYSDSGLKHFTRLRRGLDPYECRGSTEVKVDIFLIDLGLDLTVFFKDERIVVAAYHEDPSDTETHERIIVSVVQCLQELWFYRIHNILCINMFFCETPPLSRQLPLRH